MQEKLEDDYSPDIVTGNVERPELEISTRRPPGFNVGERYLNGDRHIFLRNGLSTIDNEHRIVSLSDDELTVLEADMVLNGDIKTLQATNRYRQYANHVGRALLNLHAEAMPLATRMALRSNDIGRRVFVADAETSGRFDGAWINTFRPPSSDEQQSVNLPPGMSRLGTHYTTGSVILLANMTPSDIRELPTYFSLAQEVAEIQKGTEEERLESGLGIVADAVLRNTLVEEVGHLVQDVALPTALEEVFAKANKEKVYEWLYHETGEIWISNSDDAACRSLCEQIEEELHHKYPDMAPHPLDYLNYGTFDAAHLGGSYDYEKIRREIVDQIKEGAKKIFKPGQYNLDEDTIAFSEE